MYNLKRLIYGIKRHSAEVLSLDLMSEHYHVLAINYIYLMIYSTLESVFVNTLLYRVTPDISIVIIYRGIIYVASAVMMHLAAFIGKKATPVIVIRLGGIFYLIMYAVLFFGMNHMGSLMYVTAVLAGTGGAFYWAGHNILIPHYTTVYNRDIGLSILGIIQGVATLFVPIISGPVISLAGTLFGSPDVGYRVIFGVGIITAAAQVIYQRNLPAVEQPDHKSGIIIALGLLRREITYKYAMCFEFLRGFRDGTFTFILNMILFSIITSESLVGLNSFLTGVTAITGAWAYGKLVKPKLRMHYALIATTAMMLFCLLLLLNSSAPLVMFFAMINSFFALFVVSASGNTAIDVLTQSDDACKCVGESVAIREIFIALGRIAGLYVFTMFPADMRGRIYAMLILTGSQYLLALLLGLTLRTMSREQDGETS